MTTLIDKLRALEGPSREVDFAIGEIAIGLRHIEGDLYDTADPAGLYYSESGDHHAAFPAYTSSIDAALTLVPEGCIWLRLSENSMTVAQPNPNEKLWSTHHEATGATPAIALCIASLIARGMDHG